MTVSTRPSSEPDNSYAPMARRPIDLECGHSVHFGHLDPPCCLVGWLLHESRMEITERLHALAVPSDVEHIPVNLREPDGPKIPTLDVGPLAGRPWSAPMNRHMDISYFEGETLQRDDPRRPLARAMAGLRRYCAGKHGSWYEHRGRPVCWLILRSIIQGRMDVRHAALGANVTPERAAYLLHRFDGRSWQGSADKLWTWVANDVNEIRLVRRRTT